MNKLLITLIAIAPLFAQASATYTLLMENNRDSPIDVSLKDSSCMEKTWPKEKTSIEAGKAIKFKLTDNNPFIGSCSGAIKYVKWDITDRDNPEKKVEVYFAHEKVNIWGDNGNVSEGWVTEVLTINRDVATGLEFSCDAENSDDCHRLRKADYRLIRMRISDPK